MEGCREKETHREINEELKQRKKRISKGHEDEVEIGETERQREDVLEETYVRMISPGTEEEKSHTKDERKGSKDVLFRAGAAADTSREMMKSEKTKAEKRRREKCLFDPRQAADAPPVI